MSFLGYLNPLSYFTGKEPASTSEEETVNQNPVSESGENPVIVSEEPCCLPPTEENPVVISEENPAIVSEEPCCQSSAEENPVAPEEIQDQEECSSEPAIDECTPCEGGSGVYSDMEEESTPIEPVIPGSPDIHVEVGVPQQPLLEEVEAGQDPLQVVKEDEKVVAAADNLVLIEREMTQEEQEEYFPEPPSKYSKVPPHLNPDNLIRIMAHQEAQHFPQPVVFDFCPRDRRMPFGQWWVPEGKSAAECTICEFCYNNKCLGDVAMTPYYHKQFNISGKYDQEIPYDAMKDGNCNCDCPKANEHPKARNLSCPPCYYHSLDIFCRAASCGVCQECKNWTSYIGMSYCPPCSHLLKRCHECGESLKEGNAYLEAINEHFDKTIKRNQKYLEREPDMKEHFEKQLEKSIKRKESAASRFSNKSCEEIIAMAMNNYKEEPESD